jgi:hypothetical protein
MIQYKLDKEQIRKISEWEYNHNCVIKNLGAIGGKLTFSFTPTNLGIVTKVKCCCGKEIDLTDYEDW